MTSSGNTTPLSRGVVAAGDAQTAEAGAALLRAGGNAVDAAVAAAFAAFVCELPLCSPLGGGVLVLDRPGADAVAFDMFARTPGLGGGGASAGEREFDAVRVSFGAATQVFHVGRASVAVPLALAGLLEVHERFGVMPLADVVAPAVALGRGGWVVGPNMGFVFEILRPIVGRTAACHALFADASGDLARPGARLFNRDMAACFEDLGRRPTGVRDLYAALAREMSPAAGGLMTEADLAGAHAKATTPVVIDHAGWQLATMPSPSTGGVLVALGLRMLEGITRVPFLSEAHALYVARVQEALLAERDEGFAERCADPAAVRAMLADERVRVARERARNNLFGATTQISAIDGDGCAIAMTLTNGEGSGHVLTGTGMIANNLLGEEDLHPRGFHQDPAGSSLMTMMAPTILSRGEDRIALGSGGSNRLRTAILQVLTALVEYHLPAIAAVTAPRLHIEIDSKGAPVLAFEAAGLDPAVAAALKTAYPNSPAVFDAPNLYFGGVHLATRIDGAFDGFGDPRRNGARVLA